MPNIETNVENGSADEDIGRPEAWREGRYEKTGTPVDQSVVRKPGEVAPDTISTTVTRDDYEPGASRPSD